MNTRHFEGTVISDKMAKTIVVRVDRTVVHPKYGKRYVRSRKYKVHDETKQYKVGDLVTFVEGRPWSRDTLWRAVSKKESLTK